MLKKYLLIDQIELKWLLLKAYSYNLLHDPVLMVKQKLSGVQLILKTVNN